MIGDASMNSKLAIIWCARRDLNVFARESEAIIKKNIIKFKNHTFNAYTVSVESQLRKRYPELSDEEIQRLKELKTELKKYKNCQNVCIQVM